MGFKTNGHRCERQASDIVQPNARHLQYCTTHWGVYNRHVGARRHLTVVVAEQHHRIGTCHKWVANERWCGNLCEEGRLLCTTHAERLNNRIQQEEAVRNAMIQENETIHNAIELYRDRGLTWRQIMDDLFVGENDFPARIRYRIARRYFAIPEVEEPEFMFDWQFNRYWDWNINGRVGPPPNLTIPPLQIPRQPVAPLAALARDSQNVHTTVVVEQTNKGLDKLLEASKENKPMRSPDWFAARWLLRNYGGWNVVQRVVNDMQEWYNRSYCKAPNDYLYQRALDGLYLTIQKTQDNDLKLELYKRVFEECYESVGMCCEGHISRLCNVLVGFDEAFAPPVPFGEILQSKMAAIAALEVDTEEKVRQATAFFNEFAVPEPQRAAWLEAF